MTKEEIIKYWTNSSDKDYRVMNTLFIKGHNTWALFMGHLVLEKLLKAYFIKGKNTNVPYIHDLNKIADLGNLKLTEEQKDFLDEVSTFNIKARYPDYKNRFKKKATKVFTEKYFRKIKEFRSWIKKII